MQNRSFLGEVDLVPAKHGVDSFPQVALLCELLEQLQGGVSDSVLGIIQKQPCTFRRRLRRV